MEPLAVFYGHPSIIITAINYGINDWIKWRYANDDKLHRCRVHYTSNSAYFIANGVRIHLDQCIKF